MSEIYSPGSIVGPPATFMGPYVAGSSYSVGQAVSNGGSSYVSLVASNVGNSPGSSPASWGLLAAGAGSLNTTLTFASAGSQIVAHELNTLVPIVQASVTSGVTRWTGIAIDANNYRVTANGPMVANFAFLGNSTTLVAAVVAPANITTGLINYWPMNEGTGATFIDAIAANNITASGVTWSGTEATFSGVADASGARSSTQPVPLSNATSAFTVSVWVNLPSGAMAGAYVMDNTDESHDGYELFRFAGGALHMLLFKGNTLATHIQCSAASFATGVRQNLMMTYDGSGTAAGFKQYINGILITSTIDTDALGGTAVATTLPFYIMAESGTSTAGNNVAGSMDHLRIYSRVLAAGDIAAIQTGSN